MESNSLKNEDIRRAIEFLRENSILEEKRIENHSQHRKEDALSWAQLGCWRCLDDRIKKAKDPQK